MSVVFPEGNYIFCWGGLIMNAGGMTRAMLKRACTLIRAGRDVTILCAARSMEQLNGVEHYQQNGYPEISRKNFVIREAWEGERLSDNRTHHEVGILARSDTLCVELTNKGKVYWQDGVELAREYLDMGHYLGIGGVLTFKNAKKLKEVADFAPLDRILLETDCPYLAPVPFRGKRNDSTKLSHVAEELAAVKGVDADRVLEVTWENACRFYRI